MTASAMRRQRPLRRSKRQKVLEAEAAEASPAEDFPEAALEAEAAEAGSLLQETEEVVDCRPIHQE